MDTQLTTPQASSRTPIAVTFGALTVDGVGPGRNPNKHQAQLRQVTTRKYPVAQVGNSSEQSVFGAAQFNFPTTDRSSTRMAWMDVPPATTTEQVVELLKTYPNAGIKQVLSDEAILTEQQVQAIANQLTTLDIIKYGESGTGGQLVRYPANSTDGTPGTAIPGPTGAHQFRALYFRLDLTHANSQDEDRRAQPVANAVNTTPTYGQEPTAVPRVQVAPVEAPAPAFQLQNSDEF